MGFTKTTWLLLLPLVAAQTIAPSNGTRDLLDPNTSPRFWLNSTTSASFPSLRLAPLGPYAYINRNDFYDFHMVGNIVNTDASNANKVQPTDFNYVSCDPEDYEGGNLDVNSVLRIVTSQQPPNTNDRSTLIFYSTRSDHCSGSSLSTLPSIDGIFTTLDPYYAKMVRDKNFTSSSNAVGMMSADRTSYLSGGSSGSGGYSQPPTTAIAMIILYSITGIITALFIVIIITGAIRAHRHPERYGPRNGQGHPRQSRAKGIARAVLETLPIVKFGDHHNLPKGEANKDGTKSISNNDIEMAPGQPAEVVESSKAGDQPTKITTEVVSTQVDASPSKSKEDVSSVKNTAATDEASDLGCSICTEDFQKGEEVRVLPCDHKFHPDCVDPWLLNVSGTCPLCRISLAPQEGEGSADADGNMPPPLNSSPFTDRRSQHIHALMALAYGTREERVLALRRYRAERRNRNSMLPEEERVGRAKRFREALRIRTRTHEPNEVEQDMRNRGVDAISGPQTRL